MRRNRQVFQAQVANLFGRGDHFSKTRDGHMKLDTFQLSLDGRALSIKQHAVALEAVSQWRGKPTDTSVIEIEGIGSLEEGRAFVGDLCWLLSFATHSHVVPYNFRFGDTSSRIAVLMGPNCWRPPFLAQGNGEIVSFVTQVWSSYRAFKEMRSLNPLFHMIVYSDSPGTVLETQITTCIQCIESIKSYFALAEGVRFGITEKPNGQFVGRNGKSITFGELLGLTLKDVGMDMPETFPVITKLRNAIIHRGFIREHDNVTKYIFSSLEIGTMHDAMFAVMEQMQDLLREFILRLLGYKGDYWVYSQASRRPSVIS